MRQYIGTLCAVALVACSDSRGTLADPRLKPTAAPPDTLLIRGGVADPRTIPDRVADLIGNRFAKVVLPPDGFSLSSDAVHPDIACQDASWNGARCWLMYTPYKNSDASWENPGILMAATDTTWATPPSITNPLVPYPGIGAYNSDPDHAFDPQTKRLVQVYRVVADTFNNIMIMSTANAKTWTTARVAFRERNHDAVSPSLIIDSDRQATMWYVRTGAEGCNATSASVWVRKAAPTNDQRVDQAAWSAPVAANLSIPNSVIWHLDVEALPGGQGYIALVVAYQKGLTCGSSDLWIATSADGIAWRSYAVPVMWRGMQLARSRNIITWYRGTLLYEPDTDLLHIWPSGLAGTAWTIYHSTVKLHDLLALLSSAKASDGKGLNDNLPTRRAILEMP